MRIGSLWTTLRQTATITQARATDSNRLLQTGAMTSKYPEAQEPNELLRQAMASKGLSIEDFADEIGRSPRTVGRWLAGGKPSLAGAKAAAEYFELTITGLWPDRWPNLDPPSSGTVAVSAYTMRSDVPQTVWRELFHDATESIDILVYGGTFLFDAVAKFTKALTHAAKHNDVKVRILVGDPSCRAVKIRGIEEAIAGSLADRCDMTLKRFKDVDPTNIDIRLHDTSLYTSMFRADDTLIANHHLYGSPASDNPCFIIEADQHPDLWASYEETFERVWKLGTPT